MAKRSDSFLGAASLQGHATAEAATETGLPEEAWGGIVFLTAPLNITMPSCAARWSRGVSSWVIALQKGRRMAKRKSKLIVLKVQHVWLVTLRIATTSMCPPIWIF